MGLIPFLSPNEQHQSAEGKIFLTLDNKNLTWQVASILGGNRLCVQSDGVAHTRYMAEQHSREAVRQIMQLHSSVERNALVSATQRVINRLK